jgi:hypothetical protein
MEMQIKVSAIRTLWLASRSAISSPVFAAHRDAAHHPTQESATEARNATPTGDAGGIASDCGDGDLATASLPSLVLPQRSGMPPLYRSGFVERVHEARQRFSCRQGGAR